MTPAETRQLTASGLHLSSLPGRRPRLDGVDLSVTLGTVTVLVGPNGAGKSSLLSCLAGLETPDAGEVRLDGRTLASLSRAQVARTIAFVSPWVGADVSLSVAEVVSLGRLPHRRSLWEDPYLSGRAEIQGALASVDLAALASVPLRALSAGERQRARLAAALAQGAPFLLLDEPTASLDPGHARTILDLSRRLGAQGHGVVLALHDLTAAGQYADAVVLLADGRILEAGAPWDVLRPALLGEVYGTHLEVMAHPQSGRPVVLPGFLRP